MNEGILGAIASPQLADVAGALNYRQSVMDKDEAKRKEITRNKLIAQAIPNMAEDSPIRKLFEEDPQAGAMMAKMLNIPLNEGEKFEQLRSRVKDLSALAENDPREALNHAMSIQAENQRNGIQDKNLDSWIDTVNKDPVTGFNALHVMNQSLNPQPIKEGFTLGEGQTRYDSKGNVIASVKKTYDPNAEGNQATAHAKDLAEYKRLVAAGDPTAEGFGQMVGLVSREGKELTSGVTKILDDLTEENKVANYNATRYSTLANKIRNADYESGVAGKGAEAVKSLFGNEDEITAMKKELALIRNSEALKSLPAGSASEKDVAMVMEPMPTANTNPKYVANWLDAYAKVSAGAAKYTEAKADFVAKNGSLRDKEGNTFIKTWKSQQEQPKQTEKTQSAADRLKALTGGK